MRFIFRADASKTTGVGHVMRCSAIAEEIINRGWKAIFVGEINGIPWLEDWVHELGFDEVYQFCENYISNPETDILIIDSYTISEFNPFIQKEKWLAVVSIFDTSTPDYKSNLRVHPGIELMDVEKRDFDTLAGPEYFPVRKSIQVEREIKVGAPIRITVIGGGTDINLFVPKMQEILSKINLEFTANLVSNSELIFLNDKRFKKVPLGKGIDNLYQCSDLVFTTASTTALEFSATGCCVAIVCSVENQAKNYEVMSKLGIAYPIGYFSNGDWNISRDKISEIISNVDLRNSLIKKAANLIDNLGARRIVDSIIEKVLELEKDKSL